MKTPVRNAVLSGRTVEIQVITLIKDGSRHKKTNYTVSVSSDAVTTGSNGRHGAQLFIE